MQPPHTLIDRLVKAGHIPAGARAVTLSGGRTNRVWRLSGTSGDVVLKLYAPEGDNPLFPNDPAAEAICLTHPALRPLVPRLVARGRDRDAGDWLLSSWVEGPHRAGGIEAAARALRVLHAVPPPRQLRSVATDPQTLVDEGDMLLAGHAGPAARRLSAMRPNPGSRAQKVPRPVLLHGDPVASNMVLSRTGPVFLDWQCPAFGDPAHDIAIALSPAMRLLYEGSVGSPGDADAFLSAYADPGAAERYRVLRPFFHWRMAAYCLWRAASGVPGYSAAAEAELSALEAVIS